MPTAPPKLYGPVPTELQLAWHELEFYAFCHFGMATFTPDDNLTYCPPVKTYNPTDFSAKQIVQTVKDAGMKGLVLTCKHQDGFCLWPSRFTEYSVKYSPWKKGRVDVVRELSCACENAGLKFGVYLGPYDVNRWKDSVPSTSYLTYYRNQLIELLTYYGPIFELWIDGYQCGDYHKYFYWGEMWDFVRTVSPDTIIRADAGPDVRYAGKEVKAPKAPGPVSAPVSDPCYATLDPTGLYPGIWPPAHLTSGDRPGKIWAPAEVDATIRNNWFWHPGQSVMQAKYILDLYFATVGMGTSLILNVPPNQSGQIDQDPGKDVEQLREFRRLFDAIFSTNIAAGAKATASNVRGDDPMYAAKNVLDDDPDCYWCTDDDANDPTLTLEFPTPVEFSVVSLREYLPLGQRINGFKIDYWKEGSTEPAPFASGTSIGSRRLLRENSTKTRKIRLTITRAKDAPCPALREFALYLEPKAE